MPQTDIHEPLTWLVAGEAGYGISTIGQGFARACTRAGLNVFGYGEYPSLIRGGHNTAMIRVSKEDVRGHSDKIDVLLALNQNAINFHIGDMAEGGVLIYDNETLTWDSSTAPTGLILVPVPLARITKDLGASRVMRNTVALGASFAVIGMDFSYVESVLKSTFARKGEDVVKFNVDVAHSGYDYVQKNGLATNFKKRISAQPDAPKRMVITGNEAIAIGAIKAGVKFMAAYPMTPVTSIMLTVAKYGVKYGVVMKHTEDEIAAMNMAIGAAHMGVRSMTATSGGGFSLMTEALGMAAITETPLVAIEGTRPGPSTGLPTWTDQGDLRFVMHASQGEFPRVLLAPGDIEEAFEMTLQAFNLAEKYQMVVLIMTDKYLGESLKSATPFEHQSYKVDRGLLMSMEEAAQMKDGEYKRYQFTENGVSKRALPGYPNCIYTASTDEHREDGDLDESGENRKKMVDKRAKKLETLRRESLKDTDMFVLHGPAEADLTLVGWGSTKGPILEAMDVANNQGKRVNFLQIKCVLPFPIEGVASILESAKKTLLIENNAEAQMGGVIRENTGIGFETKHLRYDGRPIHAAEVLDAIHKIL